MPLFRYQYTIAFVFAALIHFSSAQQILLHQDNFNINLTLLDLLNSFPRRSNALLSKRDVCTDAIPGTVYQQCMPGNTLCCVPANTSIAYPQCQVLFNEGFCCVAQNGACYLDTQSNCTAAGAVHCTQLGPGVSEACCPEFTQCPGNFNQTQGNTRCQFTPSASTSSTSTSTAISTSLSSSGILVSTVLTTPTILSLATAISQTVIGTFTSQPNPTPISTPSQPSALSAGADAGIAVAATLAIVAIVGAALWFYRRRRKTGRLALAGQPYHEADGTNNVSNLQKPSDNGYVGHERYNKAELPDDHRRELPGEQHQLLELSTGYELQELPASEAGTGGEGGR